MNRLAKATAIPALLLALASCQVDVDNKTQAQIDNAQDQAVNAADRAGDELGNAADAAGNTADQLGNQVEQGADRIGNGVDVHVDLHSDRNGRPSGNSQ